MANSAEDIANRLLEFSSTYQVNELHTQKPLCGCPCIRQPSKTAVQNLCARLLNLLYQDFFALNDDPLPSCAKKCRHAFFERYHSFKTLLQQNINVCLHYHAHVNAWTGRGGPKRNDGAGEGSDDCTSNSKTGGACILTNTAEQICDEFLESLPSVRALLDTDIDCAFQNDPAATCREEVILSYPFVEAISLQRCAHLLYALKVPFIPRIMTECGHARTGIDIHPGATIGSHFFIDHGTGVVIGETCVIGNHVKLFHGVTLGARSFEKDKDGRVAKGRKRHPNVADGVIIYPNSTVLGGDTVVGAGSTIGGNVFLVASVPPNHLVALKGKDYELYDKSVYKRNLFAASAAADTGTTVSGRGASAGAIGDSILPNSSSAGLLSIPAGVTAAAPAASASASESPHASGMRVEQRDGEDNQFLVAAHTNFYSQTMDHSICDFII